MRKVSERIQWSSLAGVPRLFSEFLESRSEIISLLGGDWRKLNTRTAVRDQRLLVHRPGGLGSAIRESYRDTRLSPAIEKNLEALDSPETLAVVTGQQLGLFGGPMFTYYKALTTIFLARELEREHSSRVVPVFWMESGDADFSEVNRIGFPPLEEYPRRAVYTPRDIVAGRSTRWHIFSGEIETVREAVIEWMNNLPFRKTYADLLRESYRAEVSMVDAYRRMFSELFSDMGLILVDALDPALVERADGFWENCLDRPERLNNAFTVNSREVETLRLPLQVRLRDDTLPIYSIDNNGIRHRLTGKPGGWKITPEGEPFTQDQLIKMVGDNNSVFSPGVLLRPLLQDWLLPTWMYVAGPSEIAYHAQIGRAYDQINLPRPLVVPRIGGTIVEMQSLRWLKRNNWKVSEVLGGEELLLRTSGQARALENMFDNGFSHLSGWLSRIQQSSEVATVDISKEIEKIGGKLEYQWDNLRRITVRKIAERDKTRIDHAHKLQNRLLPDEILQERHYNALYYLSKYGTKLNQVIENEKDLFNPQHLVINLESD